jgi:hypothetical protein
MKLVTETAREQYENTISEMAQRVVETFNNNENKYERIGEVVNKEINSTEVPPFNVGTVLLSDQDPDNPTHTANWNVNIDTSNVSWNDGVHEAAYLCVYSDVMETIEQIQSQQ